MRTENEINQDIEDLIKELQDTYGISYLGLPYNVKYIDEYDDDGRLVGFHIDPDEERLIDKLNSLEKELFDCGYRHDRGEYGGGK